MGSSSDRIIPPSLLASLQSAADASGFVSFETFMDLALYHPEVGYYTSRRERVGRSASTDFYTASSLGPVFGELVVAVIETKLGARPASDYTFVEIGAESGRSILDQVTHPFRTIRRIGVHDKPELSGPCIVFSNELFDAQPCSRYLRAPDGWLERGVHLVDGALRETVRPASSIDSARLPFDSPPGYQLDAPRRAQILAQSIASDPWQGLFIAFDYGKTWQALTHEWPVGTVRAYHRHTQTNDLLARPGTQDLTCHICWDWIQSALEENHFQVDSVSSQEAFFVKNAASALARIMQEEAQRLSPRKSGLMQLIHPSALGQKFQGLTAWRD
ncbi:MAG: SAM-dependent methyltransferase [Candidatus Synoicihabitans palmerolidicus]|nr:SAM-dependent methyltransferase [Candidatus Synoicihabitans palmerolidicus]